MTLFGFKITLDYRSTKFEERSLACVTPEMNITRLSAENFGKIASGRNQVASQHFTDSPFGKLLPRRFFVNLWTAGAGQPQQNGGGGGNGRGRKHNRFLFFIKFSFIF